MNKDFSNNIAQLDDLYRSDVIIGEKNIDEIKEFLSSKGKMSVKNFTDVNLSDISCFAYDVIGKTKKSRRSQTSLLKKFIEDTQKYIKKYNLQFEFLAFENCAENEFFYKNYENREDIDDIVYVFFEKNSRLFFSNSNRLLLEMLIYKGIDEVEVKNFTESYYIYLTYIMHLNESSVS